MALEKKRPKSRFKMSLRVMLLTAFALSLTSMVINLIILRNTKVGLNAELNKKVESYWSGNQDHSKAVAQTLLFDSILSIIQNYYVDNDRVNHKDLLKACAAGLARKIPEVSVHTTSNGSTEVKIDGSGIVIPKDPTYMDALKTLVILASGIADLEYTKSRSENPEQIILNSLLTELDAHSAVLGVEEYLDLKQGTEGAFGGLGVMVGVRENVLTVIRPIEGSPAERAGVQIDDKIIRINDTPTFGTSLDNLVEIMRGEPGTVVNLDILRNKNGSPFQLSLEREVITVNSVTSKIIENNDFNFLHLLVESFASRTSNEIKAEIDAAREKYPETFGGVMLDFRGNPGGLLDQAVQVADLFLEEGVIVSTKGRRLEEEVAGSGDHEDDYPIVVLMDANTASASEIVAGALAAHNRAVLVGEQSFGKGSVQTIFELPGQRALKLTVARYYTPDMRSIQSVGITPHVKMTHVSQGKFNANLFGDSRFKREAFLHNALGKDKSGLAIPITPNLEGLFLLPDSEASEENSADVVLDLGLSILSEVANVHKSKLPVGFRRASYWLSLASEALSRKIDEHSIQTTNWLKKSFGIEWTGARVDAVQDLAVDNSLKLRIKSVGISKVGALDLEVELENLNQEPVQDTSVVLFVDHSRETVEFLIGRVEGRSILKKKLSVNIPYEIPEGDYSGVAAIAIASKLNDSSKQPLSWKVNRSDRLEVSLKAEFIDGINGRIKNVLEWGEKAKLKVDIRNVGVTEVSGLTLHIDNFAGRQLLIPFKNEATYKLAPNGVKSFNIPLKTILPFERSYFDVGLSVSNKFSNNALATSFVTIPTLVVDIKDTAKSGDTPVAH